jgi:hypothetical protein
MADRVFLHVGTMKSGTSYLQSLWWRHRDALRDRGLLLPGRRLHDHFLAASLATERSEVLDRFEPGELESRWAHLLEQVGEWEGDVLISHELFSPTVAENARRIVRQLGERCREVHLVVTVRDLARVVPSHWQQSVKHKSRATLEEFWTGIRDDPDDRFWVFHDVPALLDRWSQEVPAERVHVVVVPRGAAPDWLWEATCSVLGVDGSGLDLEARNPNESLGIAEVELLRRVQATIPDDERDLDLVRLTKGFLTYAVAAANPSPAGFAAPSELLAWASARGADMADELRGRGYDVTGDLADLARGTEPQPGRTPDEVSDSEVLDAAVRTIARLTLVERDRRNDPTTKPRPGARRGPGSGPRTGDTGGGRGPQPTPDDDSGARWRRARRRLLGGR